MFENFIEKRKIAPSTIKGYKIAVEEYTMLHKKTLDELILEAQTEELDRQTQLNQKSIATRLYDYQNYLRECGQNKNTTINTKMQKLFTIYKYYGVSLPEIGPLKKDNVQLTFYDLPNKEHISLAINSTNIDNQAIILFLASSGMSVIDAGNLSIRDFIEATSMYHEGGSLRNILDTLWKVKDELVPTFFVQRQKTSKGYYTFCTPEASFAIIRMLDVRLKATKNKKSRLKLDSPLFGCSVRSMSDRIRNINDKCGFGFKGTYRFFRPHSLRKFHASNLGIEENHIHELQGRGRDLLSETYIKTNPVVLKQIYMNAMDNVTINVKKQREVKNEEFIININVVCSGENQVVTL